MMSEQELETLVDRVAERLAERARPKLAPLPTQPTSLRFIASLAGVGDRRSQIVHELVARRLFALPGHFEEDVAAALGAQLQHADLGESLPAAYWTPLLSGASGRILPTPSP